MMAEKARLVRRSGPRTEDHSPGAQRQQRRSPEVPRLDSAVWDLEKGHRRRRRQPHEFENRPAVARYYRDPPEDVVRCRSKSG